jgi:ABC-type polar amino acid transport system ATPase subunit
MEPEIMRFDEVTSALDPKLVGEALGCRHAREAPILSAARIVMAVEP